MLFKPWCWFMCFAGTSQITVLGGGIQSIFELPWNIRSNLSTFAFYIGPHLTAGMLLLLMPLNSLSDFQHCMWKFLSKGENVYGKRMEHRVFDPGFDCTFSLLCQGNWKEQCITVVFFFFKLQLINGNRHWKNNLRKSNCRPGRM